LQIVAKIKIPAPAGNGIIPLSLTLMTQMVCLMITGSEAFSSFNNTFSTAQPRRQNSGIQ
jgi:hypothetical protein